MNGRDAVGKLHSRKLPLSTQHCFFRGHLNVLFAVKDCIQWICGDATAMVPPRNLHIAVVSPVHAQRFSMQCGAHRLGNMKISTHHSVAFWCRDL